MAIPLGLKTSWKPHDSEDKIPQQLPQNPWKAILAPEDCHYFSDEKLDWDLCLDWLLAFQGEGIRP